MVMKKRVFESGANRNSDEGKLDFEGFLSPTVLEAYAEYMNSNRALEDGTLRESDNWQKGIPIPAYMKSMYRHFFDVWKDYRGLETPEGKVKNLTGLLFNVMGMLHEVLKEEEEVKTIVAPNLFNGLRWMEEANRIEPEAFQRVKQRKPIGKIRYNDKDRESKKE